MSKQKQTHGFPAFLSFIIPGLGQLVKGEVGKGASLFALEIFAFLCVVIPAIGPFITLLGMPTIWLYGIYDAYNKEV